MIQPGNTCSMPVQKFLATVTTGFSMPENYGSPKKRPHGAMPGQARPGQARHTGVVSQNESILCQGDMHPCHARVFHPPFGPLRNYWEAGECWHLSCWVVWFPNYNYNEKPCDCYSARTPARTLQKQEQKQKKAPIKHTLDVVWTAIGANLISGSARFVSLRLLLLGLH